MAPTVNPGAILIEACLQVLTPIVWAVVGVVLLVLFTLAFRAWWKGL